MDINKNGIEPIEENELDAVAGGWGEGPEEDAIKEAFFAARKDGRIIQLMDDTGLCKCPIRYVFAQSSKKTFLGTTFYNVKCYKCGKTWQNYKDFFH